MEQQKLLAINGYIDRFFTKKICFIASTCLIGSYVLIFSIICIKKYLSFTYHDWDFAIYANILWNLIHGHPFSSLMNVHFLRDHASLIAYFVAIPYFIFRSPIFLLILQSVVIGITAVPIYLVARDKLENFSSLIITLMYLLYPAVHYLNLYEFYFETFSLPFLAFAFYFLLKKKPILYFLMCIGACMCKENIPLTIIALGIFGLSRPHRRLMGLAAIILGGAWIIFDLKMIPIYLTHLTGEKIEAFGAVFPLTALFEPYGKTLPEVFIYILLHPFEILGTVLSHAQTAHLFEHLLGSLAFLPLLRPDILLITAPHAFLRLLGLNINEHTIFYHSAGPMIPFVFFAFIFAFKTLFKKFHDIFQYQYKYIMLAGVLIIEIISIAVIWEGRPSLARFHIKPERDVIREEFVKAIPKDASITASLEFLSHLANRKYVYSLHSFFGKAWWRREPPNDIEYILMDIKSPLMTAMFFESDSLFDKNLYDYLKENKFGLIKARGDIFLFKKGYDDKSKLIIVSDPAPPALGGYAFKIDKSIELSKYEYKVVENGSALLQLTCYWQMAGDEKSDYAINFYITDGNYDYLRATHLVGYAILPPSLWPKGRIVVENYWLVLPKLSEGEHRLSIQLIDLTNRKLVSPSSLEKDRIDKYGKYELLTLKQ